MQGRGDQSPTAVVPAEQQEVFKGAMAEKAAAPERARAAGPLPARGAQPGIGMYPGGPSVAEETQDYMPIPLFATRPSRVRNALC